MPQKHRSFWGIYFYTNPKFFVYVKTLVEVRYWYQPV